MKRPTRELWKGLEEDGDEGMNIFRSIFSGFYNFTEIRVREANPDTTELFSVSGAVWAEVRDARLVQKENVSLVVPAVRVPGSSIGRNINHVNVARPEFHEKPHGARAAGA